MSDAPFDMRALLQRAQEMAQQLERAQESLRHRTVSATVGGGMVEVVANGAGEIMGVTIDPQAVDPRDVAMLQDLVRAAVNQALLRARELAQRELGSLTGLPLPFAPPRGGA